MRQARPPGVVQMADDAGLEQRLNEIRGNSPRRTPDVRVLASFAQNTTCRLATLGFAAGVDFDRLLTGTRLQAVFGLSPFSILRGLTFEKSLRKDDYFLTRELLREPLGFPASGARIVNLREGFPAGNGRMPARLKATSGLISEIIQGKNNAARLIDGAVLTGNIGGLPAFFEADALAVDGRANEIRVAEVKSFPKVDDRVDPDQLGAALDQAALYVMLAREAVANLGGDPLLSVSDRALVITPRNVGLSPTLSEQRVSARLTRLGRVLAGIPNARDVAAATPADISFGPVANETADERTRLDSLHSIADRVGTAYSPNCLSTCGNARFCRERAVCGGSPALTGSTVARLLPEVISLGRADLLARGATPTPAEVPAATLLKTAGRLIDEVLSPAPARSIA
ncbi:hypothetical protein [Zavarzinella formosa]|uniref:hypothetical protein n=1 Tax=Zavarzinella formosa TaxID=360055 RepID=UPI001EE67CC6|nr:hypothetical protein [Zavarzinella formosa]